ncbi:hypothetical protein GCM10022253_20460 [Sphingomonas endophytica]
MRFAEFDYTFCGATAMSVSEQDYRLFVSALIKKQPFADYDRRATVEVLAEIVSARCSIIGLQGGSRKNPSHPATFLKKGNRMRQKIGP